MPTTVKARLIAGAVALLLAVAVAALAVGDGPVSLGLRMNGATRASDVEVAFGEEATSSSGPTATEGAGATTTTRRGTSVRVDVSVPTTPTLPTAPAGVTVPTTATRPRPSTPLGCDAVDAAIAASRPRRRTAAMAADQSSRADRLGQYLFMNEPHDNSRPGWSAPVTRDEVANSPYQLWETRAMLDERGYAAGYHRNWTWDGSWSHNDGGGALVLYVYEFASTDAALAFEDEALHRLCQETAEVFATPGVPGGFGIGFRNMGGPPATDRVSFVRGPRYYVVANEIADPPPTYPVLDFARDEAALAR